MMEKNKSYPHHLPYSIQMQNNLLLPTVDTGSLTGTCQLPGSPDMPLVFPSRHLMISVESKKLNNYPQVPHVEALSR